VRNSASLSEIVGEFRTAEGIQEVRATADGNYNEDTSQLLVKLDSSLRPLTGQSNAIQADWLPKSETIKVSISSSEAFDAVKEIFGSWVPRVRKRIPHCGG
jgi:hypothetical protein